MVKEQLARYKYPRWYVYVDQLPKTGTRVIRRVAGGRGVRRGRGCRTRRGGRRGPPRFAAGPGMLYSGKA